MPQFVHAMSQTIIFIILSLYKSLFFFFVNRNKYVCIFKLIIFQFLGKRPRKPRSKRRTAANPITNKVSDTIGPKTDNTASVLNLIKTNKVIKKKRFNKIRQYTINILDKRNIFKYRTRLIKTLETNMKVTCLN